MLIINLSSYFIIYFDIQKKLPNFLQCNALPISWLSAHAEAFQFH